MVLLPKDPDAIAMLRRPTPADPLRVLVSGCLLGQPCGVDGTDFGMGQALGALRTHVLLRWLPFCPEHVGLGTPRTMPDLHGGDGQALLDGEARVLDQYGRDQTSGMLVGARAMLAFAQEQRVELAVLTDMSAACGSQVVSLGCRFDEPRRYQRGVGVATALLLRHGVPVVSQRDDRTLQRLRAWIEPGFVVDPSAVDHHERDWYRGYFGADA